MSFDTAFKSFTEVFKAVAVHSLAEASKKTLIPEIFGVTEKQLGKMDNDELKALIELSVFIRAHAARRDSPEVIHAIEQAIGVELIQLDRSPHSHVSGDDVQKYQELFDPEFFE